MGANDKVAATYHGHTPTTGQVRAVYATASPGRWEGRGEEFDRWIDRVRAEAKAEALREAADKIDSLDSDVEMYNEELQATQVTYWLRAHAEQYKEEQ